MVRMNQVLGLALILALAAYPFLVYWGLQHWSPRRVSIAAALLLAVSLWRRTRTTRRNLPSVSTAPVASEGVSKAPSVRVAGVSWRLPAAVGIAVCAVAFAMNREVSLLLLPVSIGSGMLIVFGWTLIRPPTMVEQFALLLAGSLSEDERVYCRRITWVWAGFFAVNVAVSACTALFASRQVWALYNGLVAYLLMGVLFSAEFIYRHWRFRRYVGLPTDPIFRKLFPPRTGTPGDPQP